MASGIPLPISQLPAFTQALSNTIIPVTQNGSSGSITLAILLGGPYAAPPSLVGTETVVINKGGTLYSSTIAGLLNIPSASSALAGTETLLLATSSTAVEITTVANLVDYKTVYTDTGAANAYVITPSPAYTSYFTGMMLYVKIANTNGIGTSNINVNALGNKAITLLGASTPSPGQLPAGLVAHLVWNGTGFTLLNPARAFQGVFAASNANQTIATGTLTTITWKTANYDTMGFTTGATYTIVTIPTGYGISYIRISGATQWANQTNGTSVLNTFLLKNGSLVANVASGGSEGVNSGQVNQAFIFPVLATTAGDTWAIQVSQNSSGNMTLNNSATWFQLEVMQ